MGSGSSAEAEIEVDPDFHPYEYVRPGISERDVRVIRSQFENLEPVNETVQTEKVLALFNNSKEKEKLASQIQYKDNITWREFFDLNAEVMKTYGRENVEIDSNVRDTSCAYCQFTVYKRPGEEEASNNHSSSNYNDTYGGQGRDPYKGYQRKESFHFVLLSTYSITSPEDVQAFLAVLTPFGYTVMHPPNVLSKR
eukprot:TRINITY_DN719_c0_g1_i1.p1 TRINITY_DN719_c0_g1~~TRINITY_DN719_c0_g1_i1.p1  ORF type:complete len:196 (+),score=26.06 TRINITY_DN719_c0_g1_i1:210-797(+)